MPESREVNLLPDGYVYGIIHRSLSTKSPASLPTQLVTTAVLLCHTVLYHTAGRQPTVALDLMSHHMIDTIQ